MKIGDLVLPYDTPLYDEFAKYRGKLIHKHPLSVGYKMNIPKDKKELNKECYEIIKNMSERKNIRLLSTTKYKGGNY